MQGKEAEHGHHLEVHAQKIADITLVEALGEISDDHIAVVWGRRGGNAGAVAPQVFFALLGGAIGLFLVGAAFDADAAIGVATGLTLLAEAIFDRLAHVVLAHPGILVLHIDGHNLAQAWDFLLQGMHAGVEEVLQVVVIQGALFLTQPAFTGHGPLHVKAIGQFRVAHRTEAQFEHEQRMLD